MRINHNIRVNYLPKKPITPKLSINPKPINSTLYPLNASIKPQKRDSNLFYIRPSLLAVRRSQSVPLIKTPSLQLQRPKSVLSLLTPRLVSSSPRPPSRSPRPQLRSPKPPSELLPQSRSPRPPSRSPRPPSMTDIIYYNDGYEEGKSSNIVEERSIEIKKLIGDKTDIVNEIINYKTRISSNKEQIEIKNKEILNIDYQIRDKEYKIFKFKTKYDVKSKEQVSNQEESLILEKPQDLNMDIEEYGAVMIERLNLSITNDTKKKEQLQEDINILKSEIELYKTEISRLIRILANVQDEIDKLMSPRKRRGLSNTKGGKRTRGGKKTRKRRRIRPKSK